MGSKLVGLKLHVVGRTIASRLKDGGYYTLGRVMVLASINLISTSGEVLNFTLL